VRRALVLFAVIGIVFASFAYPQRADFSNAAPATAGRISVVVEGVSARALAVSPQNSLLITTASSKDRVFSITSGLGGSGSVEAPALLPIAGTGEPGSLGDGGVATAAQLNLDSSLFYERSGIVLAKDGSLFIADTANATVRKISGSASSEPGVIRSVAGKWAPRQNQTLTSPLGLAIDHAGTVFVADRAAGSLDVIDAATGSLSTFAQIEGASSVAVDWQGTTAFVSSTQTGAVYAVDLQSRSIQTLKSIAALSSAPSSDIPPCSAGSQSVCPAGLAVDGAGNLFVSDSTFGRVLRIDGPTHETSVAISNLKQPGTIAFDQSGRDLYVVEQGLNRIIVAQGQGAPPSPLSISPSSWAFPNEPVSGVSPQQQFTVTNNSTSAVSGLAVASPGMPSAHGNFSLQSTSCASTLGAGAGCTVSVSFTPTVVGANLTSTVAVSDTAGDSASSTITGIGDDFQIQLAPNQSQELSVVPGNSVTFNLQAVASGVFGQSGEQVAITCPNDVPPHSTCTVTPPIVTPTVGTPSSFKITIQTSSAIVSIGTLVPRLPSSAPPIALAGLAIVSLAVAGLFLFTSSQRRPAAIIVFVCATFFFNGCHHASQTNLATPLGAVQLLVQGSALAQDGTSLNASRGATITVDVVNK
jgi:sugar lactone lactonase YvrE